MRIKRKSGSCGVDVKRLYLPFEVKDTCPECGEIATHDMMDNYMSYPILGKPHNLGGYCEGCSHEWRRQVVLDVSLRAYNRKDKKKHNLLLGLTDEQIRQIKRQKAHKNEDLQDTLLRMAGILPEADPGLP